MSLQLILEKKARRCILLRETSMCYSACKESKWQKVPNPYSRADTRKDSATARST